MNKPGDWEYEVVVLKVVDGDTIDVHIEWDIGFHIRCVTEQRLRFADINAPEVRGVERPRGLLAKAWLLERIPVGSVINIRTAKDDAFGRWIATLWTTDGVGTINDEMVAAGHAVYKEY